VDLGYDKQSKTLKKARKQQRKFLRDSEDISDLLERKNKKRNETTNAKRRTDQPIVML